MASCETKTTVEDLNLSIGGGWAIIDAEVTCLIEGEPGEPATREYPGSGTTAEVIEVTCTECSVINTWTDDLYTSKNAKHLKVVRDHLTEHWSDEQTEWAIESLGEAEQDRYEADQELKYERQWDEQWND